MKKHAYLIVAHKNFQQLQQLISTLDDERNDLYVLIDQKATDFTPDLLTTTKSQLFYTARIPIYWGDYSLVKAEVELLAIASKKNYQYYHIISGLDLPLVSQNEIHQFFDQHPNKLFITNIATFSENQILERIRPHLFTHHFRPNSSMMKKIARLYRAVEKRIVQQLKLETLSTNDLGVSSNWCTVDHEFSCYVASQREWIEKNFKRAFCGDELFIPALVKKGNFEAKIYEATPISNQPTDFQGNLRYINWWAGNPKTWQKSDFDELVSAKKRGFLFSRKFDADLDSEIIEQVIAQLISEDTNSRS